MHFSEIIKLIVDHLSLKNTWLPLIFVLDFKFPHILCRRKNTLEYKVGTAAASWLVRSTPERVVWLSVHVRPIRRPTHNNFEHYTTPRVLLDHPSAVFAYENALYPYLP